MYPIGEILSLASAMVWGLSVSIFKIIGEKVSPFLLNPIKNTIGTICFMLVCAFLDNPLSNGLIDFRDLMVLMVSGIIGVGIADIMFLYALNIVGTTRIAILNTVYSPTVVFLAYIFLNESLSLPQFIGGALVLFAIIFSTRNNKGEITSTNYNWGMLIGFLAVILMGLAIVITKPVLDKTNGAVDAQMWIILYRLLPGLVFSYFVMSYKMGPKEIVNQLSIRWLWKYLFLGSFLGTFIGLSLWLLGMANTTASVASLLNQTSTFFIALFGWLIVKEQISTKMWLAIAIAMTGTYVILL